MDETLKEQGKRVIQQALKAADPAQAVQAALQTRDFSGRIRLVAAGKAAWQMAKTAYDCLGSRIECGVIITKHSHGNGDIGPIVCFEGGHPIPDEHSFLGTRAALTLIQGLTERDTVLFLLSGGGSALFEDPLLPAEELYDITRQLLACGADITEVNTIRKRLSGVKGGRFAALCAPAQVFSVVLSDVLGDRLDMIASGPAWPDSSTCAQAEEVVEKYGLQISDRAKWLLAQETPKALKNATAQIVGSAAQLCRGAARACRELGFRTTVLTDQLCCQAREAGSFLGSIARTHAESPLPLAFVAGGETVVKVTGPGKGGRNQEIVTAAAEIISGLENVVIFSVGSDGTDGPTDAAGGIVDGSTAAALAQKGFVIHQVLDANDTYTALKAVDGLIVTGPTGTNVNDVSVILIKGREGSISSP